jgi:biotin synthase
MSELSALLRKIEPGHGQFDKADLVRLLGLADPGEIEALRQAAYDLTTRTIGDKVHYRGIVEFSNICAQDCRYCGIRRSNRFVSRYLLSVDEVVEAALWCAASGYGSCVLQSGERRDEPFIAFVEECVSEIRRRSISPDLPQGLGITLSAGEQSPETYRRWRRAGAHRYLLRIETTNRDLFARIHPPDQRFATRVQALEDLREADYQVGTGVMIGLPGQSLVDLAADILFFADHQIDMIGMGPYIVSAGGGMVEQGMMETGPLMSLACKMIAVTRLSLQNVNIAATTALQALAADGRERGIAFGANVTMPNLTPREVRKNYQLYDGKPCIDEGRLECRTCLERRVQETGRVVGWNEWGDSPRHH